MTEDFAGKNDFIKYHHHHHSSIGALILITIGIIFLLNNFGILPTSIWSNLWRFWPVILILIGLQMASGKNALGNIIVLLVGLIFIALIILLSLAPQNPNIDSWIRQNLPGLQINQQNPWNFQNMNQNQLNSPY